MLKSIKNQLKNIFESELGQGGKLESFKTVIGGPITTHSRSTYEYPLVSVYFKEGRFDVRQNVTGGVGNLIWDVNAVFGVEVYHSEISLERDPVEDSLLELVYSDDLTKGVFAALRNKSKIFANGQTFLLSVGNVREFFNTDGNVTFGLQFEVIVTTWGI